MNQPLLGALALVTTFSSLSAQWTLTAPVASPGTIANAAAAASLVDGFVLFGGDNGGFSPSNQTWTYDGTTWTQLTPPVSPGGRAGAQMAYDSNAGVFWMYGGLASGFFGGPSQDEMWMFDGTTWSQPVVVGSTPGGTALHGISFDSVNNVTVVYGGLPNNFFPIDSDQTWEWNGTGWTQTAAFPATNPGPLERPAMCFHQGIGKTVLFGGIDVQGAWNNTTWTYDAGTNAWAALAVPGTKPGARTGARMSYDSTRNVCVLTGGADPADPTGNTYYNDTWEFDGATWTQVATTITGTRLDAMMAYMPSLDRTVLFGGINFSSFTYYGDTWEWQAGTFGSGCFGTFGMPTLVSNTSPRIGQGWVATTGNLHPTFNLAILVFGFTPLPGIDLGFVPMPGCSLFTSLDILVSINGSGGTASWTWPSVSGTLGTTFYGQALCFDPTANAFGFTISNALSSTIGN